jgi:hypothetical protein
MACESAELAPKIAPPTGLIKPNTCPANAPDIALIPTPISDAQEWEMLALPGGTNAGRLVVAVAMITSVNVFEYKEKAMIHNPVYSWN